MHIVRSIDYFPNPLALVLVLAGFSLCLEARSQTIDELTEQMMGEAGIPGLSLAYFENNQITEAKSYGIKSVKTEAPVTNETVFSAASLSKPILAYIVMVLVEDGEFDLDTPLYRYYDYGSLKHDDNYQQVTAKMILSHTSGLPNWRRVKLKFKYSPEERFSYSGEGFVWLQMTIEHITAKSLEELAEDLVFKPLEMNRTSFVWQEKFEADFATPHNKELKTESRRKPKSGNAAHSLQTTATDYARFLIALNRFDGISESSINLMLTPQVQANWKGNTPDNVFWGLGVGLQETSAGMQYWHWGDNGSFKGYFSVSKTEGKGLVYFANSSRGLSITSDLVELYMGADQPGWRWLGYSHYK